MYTIIIKLKYETEQKAFQTTQGPDTNPKSLFRHTGASGQLSLFQQPSYANEAHCFH